MLALVTFLQHITVSLIMDLLHTEKYTLVVTEHGSTLPHTSLESHRASRANFNSPPRSRLVKPRV